jgi:hypothetical protein
MTMKPGDMEPGDRLKTVAIGAMSAAKTAGRQAGEQPTPALADMQAVEAIIAGWPAMSRHGANEIIGKYGPPNEATDSRLIWYNNGPWKRTICYRDEVPHHFPNPHSDTVECVIDYRVPPEMFSELARFDGSVIVERTKGEVSARCDMESANFLAINLMHEIVTGKMTAEEARKFYTETAAAYVVSRSAPYAEGFQFPLPQENTSDTDTTTIAGAMVRQTAGKVKDTVKDLVT